MKVRDELCGKRGETMTKFMFFSPAEFSWFKYHMYFPVTNLYSKMTPQVYF